MKKKMQGIVLFGCFNLIWKKEKPIPLSLHISLGNAGFNLQENIQGKFLHVKRGKWEFLEGFHCCASFQGEGGDED